MLGGSIDISYLDEFVYLAESLSYRRTADYYYVNRSVISRHVTALEEAVGARLLERDCRGVELTAAGRAFYHEAKVVLRDWERALECVRVLDESEGPLVRVGYTRNAARPVIVRFARHMAEAHPDMRLSLACMEYNDLQRALGDQAIDVAITLNLSRSKTRSYRSTLIYEDCFYPVCAESHPLARRTRPLSLGDLRNRKLLLPAGHMFTGLFDFIDQLAVDRRARVPKSFYEDMDTLFLKVQTEGYVAFSSGVYNAMFGDRLVVLPIKGAEVPFSVSAFYHDEFSGALYRACCEGFEWCRSELALDVPELDFSHID